MPYKDMRDRDTYPAYDQTDKAKKARAQRNKARRMLEREGRVSKGDGKDVHHKTPLSKGGSTNPGNLAVVPASKNRTFKRNKDHSMK
jgi:hypothetical protein